MVRIERKRATHGSYTSKYFVLKPLREVVEPDLAELIEARRLIDAGRVKSYKGGDVPFVLADQLRRTLKGKA